MNERIEKSINSQRIQRILHLLKAEGVSNIIIECVNCIPLYGRFMKGFFSIHPTKVTICQDNIESQEELHAVLAHELSHALDYTRGNKMETPAEILLTEYRAAYYGDCYEAKSAISFKRKSCIINRGKMNASNVIDITNIPFKSIYEECVRSIQEEMSTNSESIPIVQII